MQMPDAKAAVGKEWEKLRVNTGMAADKSQKQKKEVIDEARKEGKTVHCASSMDICHLKNSELEPKFQKLQRPSCTPRWHCKILFRLLCSIHRATFICVTKMTAANVMDVIARPPGCAGPADAVSAYTQVRMEKDPSLLKIPVGMSRFLDTSNQSQMAEIRVQDGRPSRSSWAKSARSSSGRPIMGKAVRESSVGTRLGKSSKFWECSCLCMWTTKNWLERNRTSTQCWKYLWKKSIWASQHHPLTMFIWVALKENAKRAKMSWKITEICLNPGSLQEQKENHFVQGNLTHTSPPGPMMWKVMQRNVWSDIASWRTKTSQQLNKVTTPCLDDHQFKEEELGSVEEMSKACSQIVLKFLYLARIGRPDILWSVNKLARAVTKWTRACDKRLARLISFIHHTSEFKQYCHVGNTAQRLAYCGKFSYSAEFECIKSPGDTQSTQSARFESHSTQSAGKPAAGGSNQNDAASSSQVWLTDAKMSERAKKTRCCRNEPGSEFSRTCKETCRRKFRHQRRGRLEVAAQLPHISC